MFDMVPSGFPRKIQHDSFRVGKLESTASLLEYISSKAETHRVDFC